jgi:hypothetical protein
LQCSTWPSRSRGTFSSATSRYPALPHRISGADSGVGPINVHVRPQFRDLYLHGSVESHTDRYRILSLKALSLIRGGASGLAHVFFPRKCLDPTFRGLGSHFGDMQSRLDPHETQSDGTSTSCSQHGVGGGTQLCSRSNSWFGQQK